MFDSIKYTAVLVLVAVVCSSAISIVRQGTLMQREHRQQERITRALHRVIPAGWTMKENKTPVHTFWTARADSTPVGFAFHCSAAGYAGQIDLLVGVDTGGVVTGLCILSQQENSGFGSGYIPGAFYNRNKTRFEEQFRGMCITKPIAITTVKTLDALPQQNLADRLGQNSVCAVSGATVSTQAIVTVLTTTLPRYVTEAKQMEMR
jgi:Na+-translocating ferredoxin:NAD+ oxidoreductase RnfG subunit